MLEVRQKQKCGGGLGMIIVLGTIQALEFMICHFNALILGTFLVNLGVLIQFLLIRNPQRSFASRLEMIEHFQEKHQNNLRKLQIIRILEAVNTVLAFFFLILSLLDSDDFPIILLHGTDLLVPVSHTGVSDSIQQLAQQLISPLIFLQIVFQIHLLCLIIKHYKDLKNLRFLNISEVPFSDQGTDSFCSIRGLSLISETFKERDPSEIQQNRSMITSGLLNHSSNDQQDGVRAPIICSICLQEFVSKQSQIIRLPNCQHIFHSFCIRQWSLVKHNCPLCRESLTSQIGTQ